MQDYCTIILPHPRSDVNIIIHFWRVRQGALASEFWLFFRFILFTIFSLKSHFSLIRQGNPWHYVVAVVLSSRSSSKLVFHPFCMNIYSRLCNNYSFLKYHSIKQVKKNRRFDERYYCRIRIIDSFIYDFCMSLPKTAGTLLLLYSALVCTWNSKGFFLFFSLTLFCSRFACSPPLINIC